MRKLKVGQVIRLKSWEEIKDKWATKEFETALLNESCFLMFTEGMKLYCNDKYEVYGVETINGETIYTLAYPNSEVRIYGHYIMDWLEVTE